MSRRLVVVGDALLDRDVDGAADRLCPDAPAPVLAEAGSIDRPGGAGLAALLANDLGYQVTLVTALAGDPAGQRLRDLLTAAGIEVCALPARGTTPEKIRFRAAGQVLLRLDRGQRTVSGEPPPAALAALRDAAAVLVSDYGGGIAGQPALRARLSGAGAAPLVWDPHPRGPVAVPGARLVAPNERDLPGLTHPRRARGRAAPTSRLATVARDAAALRAGWRAGAVAVTLGPDGALLSHAGPTPLVVPVPARFDGDSCGAGDRFAAAAAAALADGALVSEAVEAAVARAAGYVAAGGPAGLVTGARPPPDGAVADPAALVAAVRERGGTVVATGGCFDLLHAGHVATLQAARRLGDCLVVCLNSDASVRARKGPGRPVVPQADRARILAALGCVDAVLVFDEPAPDAMLDRLRPDLWVKGGDYADGAPGAQLPEAELVQRWGGQAVVVPYLAGRSTTKLVAAARGGPATNGGHR